MARRKTATQIAASKRNLIKARQARSAKAKYGDLPAGTYPDRRKSQGAQELWSARHDIESCYSSIVNGKSYS